MAIRAVHRRTRFVSQPQSESGTEVAFVKSTLVYLAGLDAYLATAVTCFSDDGTGNAGGHRKKLYHDTFVSFLAKAYNQLTGCVKIFLEICSADELSVSF